ncbi:methyltransferase domain-containing protein [Vulcanococcus limneticus Candia 3F8]|uniref:methyltransferase domain-containing protein n=1 Tax=Vulcanococcus limneticus TaxID=2170428 RepID=UPI000B99BB28|nr:methyltransferase domain-containing protein [Vulcanococcus limneticus]MCP9792268.1 methyltransferase domain-containing protein [Vulcanococcus limneticus MW73D5]MCP9894272.1 methyltransferase domain-containing protein [Vulcanococcus limneticus Candia 3F8]MCP9897917.1 methyltransferase domain-containing protein [Vulcanococcus limneticus Candia 3B3]
MSDYVLGTHDAELARLGLQHELWRPAAQAAWRRAGLGPGQRVLELGAGPGLAALELARAVGPEGRVLGLELSAAYVAAGQALAEREGLDQLELRRHDLLADPLPAEGFDLIWCRWVAMFLPELDGVLDQLAPALRPGGRVVFHEYLHWDTFGLHPHGTAIRRFGQAAQRSFRDAGGDPNVNRRLPSLLAQRGFQINELRPLPVLGQAGSMAAQWMESFVVVYGPQLQRLGLWSAADAAQATAEIAQAQRDAGSYWVGPTLLELRATK